MFGDTLFETAVSAYAGLYDGLIESLTKRILGLSTESALDEAIRILDDWKNLYGGLTTSTLIAAELEGAEQVASLVPYDRAPPDKPPSFEPLLSEGDDWLDFPIIDRAAKNLWTRRLMLKRDFDALERRAKEKAFTVAGVYSEDALHRIRDSLAESVQVGGTRQEWADGLDEDLKDSFISPLHQEIVYRNNTKSALAIGQEAVAEHSFVADLFPYVENLLIADGRQTELCQAISESGIGNSGIFRTDDPTWQKFKNPRHFNCRCSRNYLTLDMAADKGIKEAQEWLESGKPPETPAWVAEPRYGSWAVEHEPGSLVELPKGWDSVRMSWDESKHPRGQPENKGEFAKSAHADDYAKNGIRAKAFKAWFGDWENEPENASKVVNEDGEPQKTHATDPRSNEPVAAYHGTNASFDAFDPDKIGTATDEGFLGQGFYFSTDPAVGKNRKNTLAVYLNIRNPLRLEFTSWKDDKRQVVRKALGLAPTASAADVTEAASEAGHDGVILDFSPAGYKHKELVAFEPNQIKAVANQGTFDPKSDKIHLSH